MKSLYLLLTVSKSVYYNHQNIVNVEGNGVYNYWLLATSSLVLLAIGVDLFGFSLVVTAACDLQLSVSEKGILTSIPFVGECHSYRILTKY